MALGLLAAAPAYADTADELSKFERIDVDGGGCISWEEMRDAGSAVFGVLDVNDDGLIAADELFPVETKQGQQIRLPPVDPAAYQAQLKVTFDEGDKDGNGCLDAAEYAGQ